MHPNTGLQTLSLKKCNSMHNDLNKYKKSKKDTSFYNTNLHILPQQNQINF